MSEKTLRIIRSELVLLLVVSAFSVTLSLGMMLDSIKALLLFIPPLSIDYILLVLKICELAIGSFWFAASIKVLTEASKAQKVKMPEKAARDQISEEETRERTFRLIRDLVGLYRGFYREIKIVVLLALLIGFAKIGYTLSVVTGLNMNLSELAWELSLTLSLLIFPSIIYIYLERKWGRKLLRIRDNEEKLQDFLR